MKRSLLIIGLMVGWASGAWAQAYVVTTDGKRMEGTAIHARPDGSIILITPTGRLEFPRERVQQAVAPRPPEYDQAVRALQEKRYDDGIRLLREVVKKARYLSWDEAASKLLGRAYMEKGDLPGALAAFEEHIHMFPHAEQDMDWMWHYLEALFQAKEFSKLEPRLNKLVAEGARKDAARAQIMRGDIKAAAGQLEAAVLDYLRAVMFYASEKDLIPGALLRTAQTLERMRDPRAKDWYRRLAEEYPSSPEAAEARAKI